jgi:putative transposase
MPAPSDRERRHERKLHRRLSRCQKGSKRRRRAAGRLANHKHRQVNRRKDAIHKASTDIANRFGLVAIEDLKTKRMTKSARGTINEPGTNVRAKAGLNRSILEQGWGMFATVLDYKLKERGGVLVKIDPRFTSQKCSCCGHTAADNRLTQARFVCQSCGHTANADINASQNILAAGLAAAGRGVDVRPGLVSGGYDESSTCLDVAA